VAVSCYTVVRGKRMRVTRLDECGNVPDAPGNQNVVTSGFVTVSLTAVIEEGDDIVQKNANGDLVVNDRSRNQFKRWDVAAEFAQVDPAILSLMTNARLEEDFGSNVVGVRQPEGGTIDSFALEVWTGVPGTDCVPDMPSNYGYLLLPFVVGGPLGDITIENGAATFSVASYTRGAGGWGKGPYDVVATDAENTAGPLAVDMGSDEHLLMRLTTIEPPEPDCDFKTTPLPAS
jgi:hypothetical protein